MDSVVVDYDEACFLYSLIRNPWPHPNASMANNEARNAEFVDY